MFEQRQHEIKSARDKYDNANMLLSYLYKSLPVFSFILRLPAMVAGNFDVGATMVRNEKVMWLKQKL